MWRLLHWQVCLRRLRNVQCGLNAGLFTAGADTVCWLINGKFTENLLCTDYRGSPWPHYKPYFLRYR